MDDITSWGQLLFYVVTSVVGIALVALRQVASRGFDAWASRQDEEKNAVRIERLKSVVQSGLETVEHNIVAEMEKDVRAAMADGVLTGDERDQLRAKISSYARKTLGTEGVSAAQEVYGIAEDLVDDWLANRVEGSVATTMLRLTSGGQTSVSLSGSFSDPEHEQDAPF